MLRLKCLHSLPWVLAFLLLHLQPIAAETFTVATYNLERYGVASPERGAEKSEESKLQVQAVLKTLAANVIALQELGGADALAQLRDALKSQGLDYPYSNYVAGHDTNANMGVLSRYPILANRSHTNASFLLNGRQVHVQRGFAEVDIRVDPQFEFTLIAAHLKSKLASVVANEDDMREHEATLLREIIDARLLQNPKAKLVVAGDFNDTKDSASVKIILGKGRNALWDTRPAEKNGDDPFSTQYGRFSRKIVWTHYYAKEDTYSRIDYILLSPGMANNWNAGDAHVLAVPNWGLASDHRPISATFQLKK